MIPAATIAQLRSITNKTLTDTCTIERETQVQTGLGHETTWTVIASDTPCRLIRAGGTRGMTSVNQGQEVMTELYRLILKHDNTDLSINCRVTVNGQQYEVQDIRDGLTDRTDVQATLKGLN